MAFGRFGLGAGFGRMGRALLGGVSASQYAPYPAPSGYHWAFVTYNAINITYRAQPVVYLVKG